MEQKQTGNSSRRTRMIVIGCILVAVLGIGIAVLPRILGRSGQNSEPTGTESAAPSSSEAGETRGIPEPTREPDREPVHEEDPNRTNNACVGDDFGPQGTNGWRYQYSDTADPLKAVDAERYTEGDRYEADGGVEIKRDYIAPGEDGRSAVVTWAAARDGRINIDLEYTKLKNEDANPDFPDGVTLRLMVNSVVLEEYYFPADTEREETRHFSVSGLAVHAGDLISMLVDPGENAAYDGGKYRFVIEDADRAPVIGAGDWDNNTSLENLYSIEQGTDGWWFLEGKTLEDARVLTKTNADGTAYISVRTEALEMKRDYVHPGLGLDAIYQWIAGEDQEGLKLEGSYVKFGHQDPNPDWPDGVTLTIWHNGTLLLEEKVPALAGDGNDNEVKFEFTDLNVKAGDAVSFQISSDGNSAWDGGRLSVRFGDGSVDQPGIEQVTPDPNRTNSTGIPESFSGKQGYDGWYYGYCDWDGRNFTMLPYDAENERYYNNGKPELKKDFVEPGNGKNAAYKWIVARDGTISITGEYVKFANNADPGADGTCVRIFLNGVEKKWMGDSTMGNFGGERSESFELTLDVKAGDVLIFAVNPEGNDSWDGGRLALTIRPSSPAPGPGPEPAPEAGRENRTVLAEDFSGTQGKSGWYYGYCDWDSKNFTMLPYDAANDRYFNGKPELKRDFVEPGDGKNAAYKWIVAQDGTISVRGEYVKFANNADPSADGTCVRIFLNGVEKKWMGGNTMGNFGDERSESFDEVYEVKAGDVLIFAVNPEGNDSWDGGRLSVVISPAGGGSEPAPGPEPEPEPEPGRTNSTVLFDDFTGTQGENGWYYGACDWDSKNFTRLPYDAENDRYFNNGKPELKKDYVEPGNGRNAAYKWIVAEDGVISVTGSYVKFANKDDAAADGTCMRIFLNGEEKKWLGITGNFAVEKTESFDLTLEVKAGDELIFAVDPESNDYWDGGRLSVTIKPAGGEPSGPDKTALNSAIGAAKALYADNYTEETWAAVTSALEAAEAVYAKKDATQEEIDAAKTALEAAVAGLEEKPEEPPQPGRTNSTVLYDDFSGTQGENGWYYGSCSWDGTGFATLEYDGDNDRYYNNGKPELKKDFVEPGNGLNAAYKWIVAENGVIHVTGEYVKFKNSEDPEANGTCVRIFLNGGEKKFLGTTGNFGTDQTVSFDEVYEVKAGDELLFAVNPEGNDNYDGGRLSVTITAE